MLKSALVTILSLAAWAAAAAPAVPATLAPKFADPQKLQVQLGWTSTSNTIGYRYQVSKSKDMSAPVVNDSTVGTAVLATVPDRGTKYFWHVRSGNADGVSAYSPVDSFQTALGVTVPVAVSPADKAINIALQPTLK